MAEIALKDHFRETQVFSVRAVVAFVFCALMVLMLIGRLIFLQVVDHGVYTTLSENNRFQIAPLPPTRGLIYDRNGVILAQNQPTYALELIPEQVKDIDATIAALGELIPISEYNIENFKKELKRNQKFKSIALRARLSDEEVAKIAVNRHRFPGVETVARLVRHYPHGVLGAHVIGYVGRINEREWENVDQSDYDGTNYIGKTGIEKFYEDRLHGHVGVQQVETNATGRSLRTIEQVPAVSGNHLHLSLDAGLQSVAELSLQDLEFNGALAAINVKTGAVLALASVPSFDPNLFVTGIDTKTYHELQSDINKPLYNRAMQARYPPGSTVKPFIGLAGLELGVIKKDDEVFCRGYYRLPGVKHKYRDWKKEGHGKVNLTIGIRQSCDVYFYSLANKLGIDRMAGFMKQFGFGERTGVDISGEGVGLWPSTEWKMRARKEQWYQGETLIAGIGQGYTLITPLQMAHSVATLASYGKNMQPRIVDAIENSSNGEKQEFFPIQEAPVPIINRENWDAVIEAMKQVVHHWHGTAHRIAKDAQFTMAGKTGTAQVFSVKQNEEYEAENVEKHLRDHGLFISFAPVEDPQIAIAVVVENGGHGGSVAAPIARKVMDSYLLPILHEKKLKEEKIQKALELAASKKAEGEKLKKALAEKRNAESAKDAAANQAVVSKPAAPSATATPAKAQETNP